MVINGSPCSCLIAACSHSPSPMEVPDNQKPLFSLGPKDSMSSTVHERVQFGVIKNNSSRGEMFTFQLIRALSQTRFLQNCVQDCMETRQNGKCLLAITCFKSSNLLFIDKAPHCLAKMLMEAVTASGGIPLLALRVPVIAPVTVTPLLNADEFRPKYRHLLPRGVYSDHQPKAGRVIA